MAVSDTQSPEVHRLWDLLAESVHDSLTPELRGPGSAFDDWRKMVNRVSRHKGVVPQMAYDQLEELLASVHASSRAAIIEFDFE